MRFFMCLLVGAVAVSPVQKVIQLLDELKGKARPAFLFFMKGNGHAHA